jgi:hypothetical protein
VDKEDVSVDHARDMINDRSGLWLVTQARVSLIKEFTQFVSSRNKATAIEMVSLAEGGSKFWPTKAEYYSLLREILLTDLKVSKNKISIAIASIVRGSKIDNVSEKEWVKSAVKILSDILKER